jgi:hypothetical protein
MRRRWVKTSKPSLRATATSVMPAVLADNLGLTPAVRSIPIVDPDVSHVIGLVVPQREPMTPLIAALVAEAKKVAARLRETTS